MKIQELSRSKNLFGSFYYIWKCPAQNNSFLYNFSKRGIRTRVLNLACNRSLSPLHAFRKHSCTFLLLSLAMISLMSRNFLPSDGSKPNKSWVSLYAEISPYFLRVLCAPRLVRCDYPLISTGVGDLCRERPSSTTDHTLWTSRFTLYVLQSPHAN